MAVHAASLETIHAVVEEISQVVIGQAPLIRDYQDLSKHLR